MLRQWCCAVVLFSAGASFAKPTYTCEGPAPVEIWKGQYGKYKVKDGLESKEYTGFLKREKIKLQDKCSLPILEAGDVLMLTYPEKAPIFDEGNMKFQCVESDNPEKALSYDSLPATGVANPPDLLLKCGSDEKYECHDGSNSERREVLEAKLKKKKQEIYSISIRNPDLPGDIAYRETVGKRIFCQFYNSKTKKVALAFEFNGVKPKAAE
ncbi:hypothetical protein [Hyalangium versicolor]|uniref:hypothetical protein n=1 Tax=Hyalangium versicolor TaxID=2861190 RepID=UPI001CC9C358|nr:hypothetical protein [Hyalangium versicolor]